MGRHQHAMPSGPVDPSFPWADSAEIPASGSTTVRFPTRPGRHVAFDEPLDARRTPTGGHLSTGPAGRRPPAGPSRRRDVHATENQARAGLIAGESAPAPAPGPTAPRTPARPGSVATSRRRTTDGPGPAGSPDDQPGTASADPDDPAGEPDPGGSRPGEPSAQAPAGRLPPDEIPTRDLPVRAGARNGSVRTRRTGETSADQASEPAASGRDVPGSPGMRARRVVVTGPVDPDVPALPVRPRPATEPKRSVAPEPDPDRPDLDTLRRVLAALHRL